MAQKITVPDPDDFSTRIDNPYLTLHPGTTFVYENKGEGEEITVVVTDETVVVDGVTCVVVHDTERVNGVVVEDTFDWFAQDADGNVWYFGEATTEFEPGDPGPGSTEGSWTAGVDGAEAGIVMLADPMVGDRYVQESAPGIAEDRAVVLSLDANVRVGYGAFEGALKTRDINPLDPSVENKFYVRGVGNVLTTTADGDFEELTKVIVDGGAGRDKLRGYVGDDFMYGRARADVISGKGGDDRISGGSHGDKLFGGSGFDRLDGGRGDDVMAGGGGGDRFVFGSARNGRTEVDTINDYDLSEFDVLDIVGGAAGVASETLRNQVWELTFEGDADMVRLVGVSDRNDDGHIVDDLLLV